MKKFKTKSEACVINVRLIILRMVLVSQQKKRNLLIGHFKAYSKTKLPTNTKEPWKKHSQKNTAKQ